MSTSRLESSWWYEAWTVCSFCCCLISHTKFIDIIQVIPFVTQEAALAPPSCRRPSRSIRIVSTQGTIEVVIRNVALLLTVAPRCEWMMHQSTSTCSLANFFVSTFGFQPCELARHLSNHSATIKTTCYSRLVASRAFQFAILIDSIRYANRFESIRFVKKSAFRFTSCHAVCSCLFIV